jgi:hypothetical protein
MPYKRCLVVICGALLLTATHASAQPFVPPAQPAPPIKYSGQGSPAIGPDGTYYLLVPATGSTAQMPVTELVAVGLSPTTPANTPKWSVTLSSGEYGPVLPGATNVYVVQKVTSGSGRSATTTSVLLLSAASGSQVGTITPTGDINDIEVQTIGGVDYLYVYTTITSSSTSNGTTTYTTTLTLTIYSPNATILKTVPL